MDLDKRYILCFIRQNTLSGHPVVLLYGEPDEEALNARAHELANFGIEVIPWRDPDVPVGHDDFGLTGIVTEPITKSQHNKLPRYQQWSASRNTHPATEKQP